MDDDFFQKGIKKTETPSNPQKGQTSQKAVKKSDLGTKQAKTLDTGIDKFNSITDLLKLTVKFNASDLHIVVGLPPMLRINGTLRKANLPILKPEDTRRMISSMLSDRQREEYQNNHQLDLGYEYDHIARFRVNAYFERNGESAAFRLIPTQIQTIKELGLPAIINSFAYPSKGLVLVTGPTGSGKTTTLAAIIDLVNKIRYDHIITIEDPIEFIFQHRNCIVSQREVHTHTESFLSGLKVVLREDPDVILVGEMRDFETISLAVRSAETGHLVFATLHTSSAISTIDRIIDVFPMEQQAQIRAQLADTLYAIICQNIIPTADGKGRCVTCEVLIATTAVRNLIREEKSHQIVSIMQASKSEGMQLMDDSLLDFVKKGMIKGEEAYKRARNKKLFLQYAPDIIKKQSYLAH